METHQRLDHFFRQYKLNKHAKLLLACSGGIDSMVLLHLLLRSGFQFGVVHCNFKLRGVESDQDEVFVKAITKANQLRIHTKQFNTQAHAKENGISIQMSARTLRYNFFESLQREHAYDYVLTAHHQNDSFETFLINLGRGSGAKGLLGIPATNGSVLRPLIDVSREEIEAYAKENKLEWREDASNQSVKYRRNAIRHNVLPKLLETTPGYRQGFEKSMQHLSNMEAFARLEVQNQIKALVSQHNAEYHCQLSQLRAHPAHAYILHEWLSAYANFDLDAILKAISQANGQYFNAGNYELIVQSEKIILRRITGVPSTQSIDSSQTKANWGNGQLQFERISRSDLSSEMLTDSRNACLDYDKLKFPLQLRSWQEGDRFIPFGMKGNKKLSDFFTDVHLNQFEKMAVPLIISGVDIVWVGGFRINDQYKLTNSSKTVYFVRFIK